MVFEQDILAFVNDISWRNEKLCQSNVHTIDVIDCGWKIYLDFSLFVHFEVSGYVCSIYMKQEDR